MIAGVKAEIVISRDDNAAVIIAGIALAQKIIMREFDKTSTLSPIQIILINRLFAASPAPPDGRAGCDPFPASAQPSSDSLPCGRVPTRRASAPGV